MNVLASASGRVVGVRGDMPDRLMKTDADRAAIKGKECGNGVSIDHWEGWKTQYCHMKQGSVTVKKDQMVQVGDVLGQVGLSGQTEFPHVHISVRKGDTIVDPFLGVDAVESCGEQPAGSMWAQDLIYQPTKVINIGMAGGAVRVDDIESGVLEDFTPTRTGAALVG